MHSRIALSLVATAALSAGSVFGQARPASSVGAAVTNVRFWSLPETTRIVIEVSEDFRYKSDRIPNPNRVYFDLTGTRPKLGTKGQHTIPVNDTLLKQIRLAETQPGTTRVVLDLAADVESSASQLANPSRLVVELRPLAPKPSVAMSTTGGQVITPSAPSTSAPSATIKPNDLPAITPDDLKIPEKVATKPEAPKPVDAPKVAEASKPVEGTTISASRSPITSVSKPVMERERMETAISKSLPEVPAAKTPAAPKPAVELAKSVPDLPKPEPVDPPVAPPSAKIAVERKPAALPTPKPAKLPKGDTSLTRVLGLKVGRIVLDPGHGGNDTGTIGPGGLMEKDLVLDITKRLGELIESRLGSEVIYTRMDDVFVPLEERTRLANQEKADLFLSIHANSSPARLSSGVETYYLNFTTDRTALEVAARENASSQMSVHELRDVVQKIALRDKVDESREFAARVQRSLYAASVKTNNKARDRGVKKAPFVVLIGAKMPSVLAEIGFVSNPKDEALFKKPEHRQKLAEALFRGIQQYASTLSQFQVARND
jgi:N-acetylmuramoyl-L-alanine amidase